MRSSTSETIPYDERARALPLGLWTVDAGLCTCNGECRTEQFAQFKRSRIRWLPVGNGGCQGNDAGGIISATVDAGSWHRTTSNVNNVFERWCGLLGLFHDWSIRPTTNILFEAPDLSSPILQSKLKLKPTNTPVAYCCRYYCISISHKLMLQNTIIYSCIPTAQHVFMP